VWQAAWVIPPEIATSAGSVEISITFYDVVDNKLAFSWNTAKFDGFLIGDGGQSVGEEFNDQYLPARDEILIVDVDSRSIKKPDNYKTVVCNYGEIGTSTIYFEIN
jgi:hypothetical protein